MVDDVDIAEGWPKLLSCVGSGSSKSHLIHAHTHTHTHTHTHMLAQTQTSTPNTSDEMWCLIQSWIINSYKAITGHYCQHIVFRDDNEEKESQLSHAPNTGDDVL